MTPEEGTCLVDLCAVLQSFSGMIAKIPNLNKSDLALLRAADATIMRVKDEAMTPVVFSQEGVLTVEEEQR